MYSRNDINRSIDKITSSRSSSNTHRNILNFFEKFNCGYTRGTRAKQHARNPRKTQTRVTRGNRAKRRRAEPARTINTSSSSSSK